MKNLNSTYLKKLLSNHNKLFLIIFILFLAFFTRFYNLGNFYTEIDDLISLNKLKYDNLNIFDLANDKESPTYNSDIKIYIRELESKENDFINLIQEKISNLIFNLAASKTSTYAPLQYFIFGWMINLEQNFYDLKIYSRLPSAIFSILTIIITYKISRKIFKSNIFLLFLPSLVLVFSYPIIFISQRSYNYSAGVFAVTLLFYLFLRENIYLDNKKVFIDNYKIKFKKNFYFSLILTCCSYTSYLSVVLMPSFFIFKFIKNFFKKRQLFSVSNFNLFICGLMYSIMISPLLLYMIKLNLQNYGVTDSAGINGEYSIVGKDGEYIKFFVYNLYLIISKNLSFFLDSFAGAEILQGIIFLITMLGLINIYNQKANETQKVIFLMFILTLFYWCGLVFFNQTTFGPTRHLLWLTPIVAIIFTIGIKNINDFLFKSNYLFSVIIIFLITSIFFLNYPIFLNYHKDLLDEKKINNLIDKYNIKYIASDPTIGQICFMKSIKIRINICPKRYYRYENIEQLNEGILKNIKDIDGSIAFINYKFSKKNELDLIQLLKFLKTNQFNELFMFEDIKYLSGESPLYVAKQSPNFIKVFIYK